MLAFFVKFIFYLMRLIPVRLVGATGAGVGRIAYFLDKRHRNIALRNLRRIYPHKGHAWHKTTARASFAELGRTIFELPHVFLRSREFLLSRVEIDGEDEVRQAINAGHGLIYVAAHHSNWELGALLVSPAHCLYRTMRQAPFELFLKNCRERFGNSMHDRNKNMRWLPKVLKQGGAASIMVDQHLSSGTPVPFMGHLANTTTLPVAYARKYKIPVFSVILHRIGHDFRFRLELRKINFPDPLDNKEEDMIQCSTMISDALAAGIHHRPEEWLWIHRRWLYLDEQEMEGGQNA
jgi:KDO2-lipid IV(A) lauroyltransferase